ncbi:MAG: hypothetical protein V4773_11745 [Verrucomicrobiota bacterium]
MTTERKVRGDAKLEWLKVEQKKRLLMWLDEENRTYAEVVALVRDEFGVSVGKSAVGGFWRRHVLPRRYREEVEGAEGLMELPEGKFGEATLKLARMHALAALSQPEPEVRTAERLLAIVYRAERMALEREKLEWAQQRAAMKEQAAEAARTPDQKADTLADAVVEPQRSDEDKMERKDHALQKLFGMEVPPLFPGSAGVRRDQPGEKMNAA